MGDAAAGNAGLKRLREPRCGGENPAADKQIRNFIAMKRNHFVIAFFWPALLAAACAPHKPVNDIVRYAGQTLNNPDYHHGQLSPAVGVHNIQVLRANRAFPDSADGFGWTYNHAPMLAYWNQTFFLEYLSNPVGEHVPPGQTFLTTSPDGYRWSKPEPVFPPYPVPDGTRKEGHPGVASGLSGVNHQRMGFYVSSSDRLLVLAYIGLCLDGGDDPNDGRGIGRLVREVYRDGSWGPVHFIRYNKGWDPTNTSYPFYASSPDSGFVRSCEELLANPLMMQQWVEEADRDDPLIPMKQQYKALSFYHLADGRVVGLWKEGLTSLSTDGGRSWPAPVRAPGIVTNNAKIWGQRTSDGRYALVYNPSDFRWPLAVSVSDDGLSFTNLLLVHGEITTMRYGGNYKSYGPQYVRGIQEGNGIPPGGRMWVTYSMNKEDIWVSSVPVPVTDAASTHAPGSFDSPEPGNELAEWNICSPLWAPVRLEGADSARRLALCDRDPFDHARAERVFPASARVAVEFEVEAAQCDHGTLHVELQDHKGTAALRLVFSPDGTLAMKAGYRMRSLMPYQAGERYRIRIAATAHDRLYTVSVNGAEGKRGLFFAPVHSLGRVVFRTGAVRRFPDTDTPTDQGYDVDFTGAPDPEAAFYLYSLTTGVLPENSTP